MLLLARVRSIAIRAEGARLSVTRSFHPDTHDTSLCTDDYTQMQGLTSRMKSETLYAMADTERSLLKYAVGGPGSIYRYKGAVMGCYKG